jgi:hypothetical protein
MIRVFSFGVSVRGIGPVRYHTSEESKSLKQEGRLGPNPADLMVHAAAPGKIGDRLLV